jgi:hypothetical protein
MNNYSFNITPPILQIMSWNSGSKYVKKTKSNVIFDLMNKKCDADLTTL